MTPDDPATSHASVEDLLHQLPLHAPPPRLDDRIATLFHPSRLRFRPLGPLAGFAAGLIVAALIPALRPHLTPPRPTAPPGHLTSDVHPAVPSTPLYVEARQSLEQSNARLAGIPVRIERTQTHLLFYRDAPDGRRLQAEVALPPTAQLHPVDYH